MQPAFHVWSQNEGYSERVMIYPNMAKKSDNKENFKYFPNDQEINGSPECEWVLDESVCVNVVLWLNVLSALVNW